MIELPQRVLDEISIMNNGVVIHINQYSVPIDKIRKEIRQVNKNIPVILYYKHETIYDLDYFNDIYKIIDEFDNDIKISTSTACEFPYSTHPLTNLIMWKDLHTWSEVNRNSENVIVFPKSEYYNKQVSVDLRCNKAILSCRGKNDIRSELFNRNFKLDDSIVRYISWKLEDDVTDIHNNHPSTLELINEYSKSYFSFVVETYHGDSDINHYTNLTEKTLIAIMSGTMPIVLGGRGFVNSLEKMGIKTWNDEFGFGVGDSYTNKSKYKIDKFVDCINNVNKLSLDAAKQYWIQNKNHIQKNYDIISSVIFNSHLNKII